MNFKGSTKYLIMLTGTVALATLILLVACMQQPYTLAPAAGGSPLPAPTIVILPTATPDVDDLQGWIQMELIGISFEHLHSSIITDTTTPDSQPDDEQQFKRMLITSGETFLQVAASTGVEASYIADDAYPYNIPPDSGPWRHHFPVQTEVEGATKAWLSVIGARDTETREWIAVYSELGPYAELSAVIYSEGCNATISFTTGFDLADTEQVEATSLNQVVAERYPIFDHMVRSVRFPEQCAGK